MSHNPLHYNLPPARRLMKLGREIEAKLREQGDLIEALDAQADVGYIYLAATEPAITSYAVGTMNLLTDLLVQIGMVRPEIGKCIHAASQRLRDIDNAA